MEELKKIYNAGVVGSGGAGFPTHKKLNVKVEYFIINGAECEPLLQTDKYIMREKTEELLKGVKIASKIVQADKVVFALKKKYKDEIICLKSALDKMNFKLEFFFMDSIYPAGDEQLLVYEVTGRPVPPGGIPLNVGAVVSNVSTILNISNAIKGKPVIRKYVTMLGEVNNPVILDVPIGISIKECIDEAGGPKLEDFYVIIGGPMMGKLLPREEINNRVITKTDGGIILIPSDHYLVDRKTLELQHIINRTKSACIQCRYCTDLCPRYLTGHPLRPDKIMRKIGYGEEIDESFMDSLICSECGICELYSCPMGLSPRLVNIYVKTKLREKGIKFTDDGSGIRDFNLREYRKVPVSRLLSRIGLAKYDMHEPLKLKRIETGQVSIPLKQHIGKAANPIVEVGEKVKAGQIIATVDYDDMGAIVHGSIDGTVIKIQDNITIQETGSAVI